MSLSILSFNKVIVNVVHILSISPFITLLGSALFITGYQIPIKKLDPLLALTICVYYIIILNSLVP